MIADIALKIQMLDEELLIGAGYTTDVEVGMRDLVYENEGGFFFNSTTYSTGIEPDYDFGLMLEKEGDRDYFTIEVCSGRSKKPVLYVEGTAIAGPYTNDKLTPLRMLRLFKVSDELDRILSA